MRNAHICNTSRPMLRIYFGDDIDAISSYFGVSASTARRWLKTGRIPPTAQRLLSVAASGFMPGANGWEAFRIYENRLVSVSGHDVTPLQLMAALDMAGFKKDKQIADWLKGRRSRWEHCTAIRDLELVKAV